MKLTKNVPLAPLSTFRIGGRVEYFCEVEEPEELFEALVFAKEKKIPYRILAGGSNVVFPDGKLKGLLVKISDGGIIKEKNRLTAGAAVPLSEVVKTSINAGLKGLETLSGIPGTLGGAVVGNAGAYGHSISEVVVKVQIWDGKKFRWLKNGDCKFGYRESIFKKKPYIVVCSILKFRKGNPKLLKKISKDIIKLRLKKYKPGLKCPGSFFKNVLVKDVSKKALSKVDNSKIIDGKIPTGYLLEMVGAKGMRSGGIKIADFHGNLFINNGNGKASDVKKLARILKARVRRKFGIELEEEIRYF
ncbi:MAG: UDP-N-acetylmuramate dehydrogenase [Candidatus Brennerbacteria bacterium]|nr:UDP-N-acetylmuramate dehydrogenase [Candidatus Brennerbacteria bacterium]